MSEAMYGLGISTSWALALIGSDTDVARERWEKGAIVLRLSPTWVRFGTFEYFNAKGEHDKLKILDDYEKDYVCNHTDRDGRYSFSNQPSIGYWNLTMLARALSPVVNYQSALEILDEVYGSTYESVYFEIMYAKMGLESEDENDKELFSWLLGALESATIDYTLFFRKLSRHDGNKSNILDICVYRTSLEEWLASYDKRLEKESLTSSQRHKKMLQVNPKYILKNHILQEAIEKAEDHGFSMVNELLKVAHTPFEEHFELEHLCKSAPRESKNIKLSCSS